MLQQLIAPEKVQIKIDQMMLKNAKLVKHLYFALTKTIQENTIKPTVLPPSQTDNRTSKESEIQFLCEFCSKKYKLPSGLKRHQKNCDKPTHELI